MYFTFLLIFLGVPISLLLIGNWWDRRKRRDLPASFRNISPWKALWLHVILAVLYTTPWDNYLVASGVWYYDPNLVTGSTIGWVPVEEYTFFVVQTILSGLWLLWLLRRRSFPIQEVPGGREIRVWSTIAFGMSWLASLLLLTSGWLPGRYLSLILVWALPPVMLQLFFGADLLWRYRSLVLPGVLAPTLYLGISDSLAISSGTWVIAPHQSLRILVAGVLPLEELIFFLVTNMLVVFGMTLVLSRESRKRAREWFERLSRPTQKQKIPPLERPWQGQNAPD